MKPTQEKEKEKKSNEQPTQEKEKKKKKTTNSQPRKKERRKKKKKKNSQPRKKKKKKSKVVKSCGWYYLRVPHVCLITKMPLSYGNRVMETELSFAKQPFCYGSHHFWVMSYENWKHILAVFSFHNS